MKQKNISLSFKQTSIQHLNNDLTSPPPPPPRAPPRSHRQAEAAATLGAPEFTKGLLDGARGVESLSQQQDTIEEEEGCQAVDHVLEILDAGIVTGRRQVKQQNQVK